MSNLPSSEQLLGRLRRTDFCPPPPNDLALLALARSEFRRRKRRYQSAMLVAVKRDGSDKCPLQRVAAGVITQQAFHKDWPHSSRPLVFFGYRRGRMANISRNRIRKLGHAPAPTAVGGRKRLPAVAATVTTPSNTMFPCPGPTQHSLTVSGRQACGVPIPPMVW